MNNVLYFIAGILFTIIIQTWMTWWKLKAIKKILDEELKKFEKDVKEI